MSGKYWMACAAGLGLAAGNALGVGISFHEGWDTYATGESDAAYNANWTVDASVSPDYPEIWTNRFFVAPNGNSILGQQRGIDNKLDDGVDMQPGERVMGTDLEKLLVGYYQYVQTANQRNRISGFVEISLNGVHAPVGAGSLDPLAAPIPVLAIGTLNGSFTGTGLDGANNGVYFFNGQQWIRTALGRQTGWSRYWMDVAGTTVNVREAGAGQGPFSYDRAYMGGFNTVSWRYFNGSPGFSGSASADDIYVVDGMIVPEPASLGLLLIGGLGIVARRRMAA